jgi:hypothetical protein
VVKRFLRESPVVAAHSRSQARCACARPAQARGRRRGIFDRALHISRVSRIDGHEIRPYRRDATLSRTGPANAWACDAPEDWRVRRSSRYTSG